MPRGAPSLYAAVRMSRPLRAAVTGLDAAATCLQLQIGLRRPRLSAARSTRSLCWCDTPVRSAFTHHASPPPPPLLLASRACLTRPGSLCRAASADDLETAISRVEAEIDGISSQIAALQAKLEAAETAGGKTLAAQLRKEKAQLRKEKAELRNEKAQLRKKEELLLEAELLKLRLKVERLPGDSRL